MTDQYDEYHHLLMDEIIERKEEGCDVSGYSERLSEAKEIEDLFNIYHDLIAIDPKADYNEPSGLEEIHSERKEGIRRFAATLDDDQLLNKISGGWLGRCAGCQLGKPVEGWTQPQIKRLLGNADGWPLDNYFSQSFFDPEELKKWPAQNNLGSMRENLRIAIRDDDQDYTILSINILKKYGIKFTPMQAGAEWLSSLPYLQVYTAERQAYQNLVKGFDYPETAIRWNPYREWIGAQIRADGYGYVAPGWPEKAAELAFNDAALSHVKNGIYGEMFMAAAIAAAFVTDDIKLCLQAAAAEIPQKSRFSQMVKDCFYWFENYKDWEEARAEVEKKYGKYNWVHTINNAAVTILALLYGKMDFEKTICLAVSGGWDTDCNGATAGSSDRSYDGRRSSSSEMGRPVRRFLAKCCVWIR